MAHNRKKTDNAKIKNQGEYEEEEVVGPEPEKPRAWWEISDEDGYDRNTEVTKIYNDFLKKQATKKKGTASNPRKKRLRM